MAASRARWDVRHLSSDPLRRLGVVLEEEGQPLVQGRLHGAPGLGVAQLRLGLPLELGFPQLDADHGGQPLPHVLAGQVGLGLGDEAGLPGVFVQRPGEGGAEPRQVGPALVGIDAVGVAHQVLALALGVLHRDLHVGFLGGGAVVEHVAVDHPPAAVDVFDQAGHPAVEHVGPLGIPLPLPDRGMYGVFRAGHGA